MKNKLSSATKKWALLGALPLLLVSFTLPGGAALTEKLTTAQKTPSKEELTASLSSKFRLMKIRTTQLKAMNGCFFQVSEKVLEAEKKGESLTKTKAMQLAESLGLSEASKIDQPLTGLTSDPFIGSRVQNILELAQKKQQHEIDLEFQRLEREVRADIEVAKSQGIDISSFRNDMSEYAKSRIESLMWVSIFTNPEHVR
jgi:hypothetical protein